MDYSLLFGIHDCEKAQEDLENQRQEEHSNGLEEEDSSESEASLNYKQTPPDSPMYSPDAQGCFKFDSLDFSPENDIYGIGSAEGITMSLVDVLLVLRVANPLAFYCSTDNL